MCRAATTDKHHWSDERLPTPPSSSHCLSRDVSAGLMTQRYIPDRALRAYVPHVRAFYQTKPCTHSKAHKAVATCATRFTHIAARAAAKMQEPAPPVPPPKPSNHEPSRINTPVATASQSPRPGSGFDPASTTRGSLSSRATQGDPAQQGYTPDPGDQWLPKILQNKLCVMFLSHNGSQRCISSIC